MKALKEIGKKCQCWYNGKLCEAVITGNKYRWVWVTARIDDTGEEVTIRGSHVRWDNEQVFAMQKPGKKRIHKKVHTEEKPDRNHVGKAVLCRSESNAKRMDSVRRSLTRIKNTMCGIGVFNVKTRLTFLAKTGDTYAAILRNALEIETVNISLMNDFSCLSTFNGYYFQRSRALKELVRLCAESDTPCGVYAKDPSMFCIRLSGGTVIGFPAAAWSVKTKGLSSFDGEWDKKCTWNLRRLEDEVCYKYKNILW